MPPSHRRTGKKGSLPSPVLIASVGGAVVVVGLVIAMIALGQGLGGAGATPSTATSDAQTQGSCDFLKPGLAPAAGAGGTCGLKLGSRLQADSFAGQSALPADLSGVGIDANRAPKGTATVPVGGSFASLTATSRGVGAGVLSGAQPGDLVVIADFTPATTGDADIGVGARCGSTDCVQVFVSPKGKVWIVERVGGASPVQKFTEDVQVQVNRVNRLVVAVRGSQVQSWLNGSLISSVPIEVDSPGAVMFFDSNHDTTPSATNLFGLYVFAPG
jgi:hypothetical protein